MRIPVTETTALRLGQLWDLFKKAIPTIIFLALFTSAIWIALSANSMRDSAYQAACTELGGFLVRTEDKNITLCVKDVKVIKEKTDVST